jgi:hypothetical protein
MTTPGAEKDPHFMTMKDVSFLNGTVTFRAPTDWQESHDDARTLVLFQTEPTPITFRLTVVSSMLPAHVKGTSAQGLMRLASGQPESVVEELSHDRAFKQFSSRGGSAERPTFVRFWHFGIRGTGLRWLQVVFSLTVDEADRDLPAVEEVTKLMDAEIRKATFDPEK